MFLKILNLDPPPSFDPDSLENTYFLWGFLLEKCGCNQLVLHNNPKHSFLRIHISRPP